MPPMSVSLALPAIKVSLPLLAVMTSSRLLPVAVRLPLPVNVMFCMPPGKVTLTADVATVLPEVACDSMVLSDAMLPSANVI